MNEPLVEHQIPPEADFEIDLRRLCEVLGMSQSAVTKHIIAGNIPAPTSGVERHEGRNRKFRWKASHIDAFLRAKCDEALTILYRRDRVRRVPALATV